MSHNRTPRLEEKRIPAPDLSAGPNVPFVRFWFDGLVSHVHLDSCALSPEYLATTLGGAPRTIVFIHEFDRSRTFDNLKEILATVDAEARRPPAPLTAVAAALGAGAARGPRGRT